MIVFDYIWGSLAGLLAAAIMTCIEYPFLEKVGNAGCYRMADKLGNGLKIKEGLENKNKEVQSYLGQYRATSFMEF